MNIESLCLRSFSLTRCCLAAVVCAMSFTPPRLEAQTPGPSPDGVNTAKRPFNILFIICDQEQFKLLSAPGYELPARQQLIARGITFRNHYIAAAMCSPSRAAFLTGQPPQRNGVFDQMECSYVPTLNPAMPNMGSVLKKLGYSTAYFGKFELDKGILTTKDTVNYSSALEAYGFDAFAASGDVGSSPDSGYKNDSFTAGEAVRWLREAGLNAAKGGKPFFLVASFLNPHDIMYANANMPGEEVQKGIAHGELTSPPNNSLYQKTWTFELPASLTESLEAPGMPSALAEYHKGWCGALGFIPAERADMWRLFNNYYLNMIRDNDTSLQQIVDALDEQNLWKSTIVIFTADHGEMGGSHGGLRGKGPMAYEENSKVPFIIVHPGYPAGVSDVLTSHLDLLPTMIGLTGLPEALRKEAAKGLPGHDFSGTLSLGERANLHAIRAGILFNFVAPLTIDAEFCTKCLSEGSGAASKSAMTLDSLKPHLNKRGFLSFAFDGRYKFARYYAPDAFNMPKTIEEIFGYNDVQLFDLKNDPNEVNNLALNPEGNEEILLRMNALLNDLMDKEVGINDGSFLPEVIRPKGEVTFQ
ncbi:MAG: sulfatase-like hydrolase/transferase [Terrimicrobiaceae bacterium]